MKNSAYNLDSTSIFNYLALLCTKKPLIHNITNFVTMQIIANSLLAIGASPIMAHSKNELAEIIQIANALVINIGTLDEGWIDSIKYAQHLANKKPLPVIFDPVGAGATPYRTQTAREIIKNGVSIVRGNASEIMALVDDAVITRGVDSTSDSMTAIQAANILAQRYQCTVVISGAIDWIINSTTQYSIHNGSALFTRVTGMGCAVTAIIGAFAAIIPDSFKAAVYGMAVFAIAGENAEKKADGPGSFYMHLLDSLAQLSEEDFIPLQIRHSENVGCAE